MRASTRHTIRYPGHELLLEDVVRAEGCYVYVSSGRRYLDLESGVWSASLGHGHPRVLEALHRQAELVAHAGFVYTNPVVEQAAERLVALAGLTGGRCLFLSSGSEAVEYGVRVIRWLKPGMRLLTMADSYLGALGSASSRDELEWCSFDWTPCAGCTRAGPCLGCPHWEVLPWENIGAFVFEPGSASGMVRFPPEKLVQNLARVIRDRGGFFMVNEVTTGMGRTGEWFGYEHYGIAPDLLALGKGLGNGYPVSATLLSERMVKLLPPDGIPYAQSHQNDPLGAAVALEVVRVMEEECIIQNARQRGRALLTGLTEAANGSGRVKEVRGRGLMVSVEFRDDRSRAFARRIHRDLFDRGYLLTLRPTHPVLRLDPPLTLALEDLWAFTRDFREALVAIERPRESEG